MYRYILLFLFNMCVLLSFSSAQKENNFWTFGYHNGLDFSSGSPVFFQSENSSTEGSASISDADGHLLFYSNGNDVWDASGNVMPNGSGIQGNGPSFKGPASGTQGAVIVKSLADPDQYYLFTLDAHEDISSTYPGYLRYSIIDMSLNNGKGDVVSSKKNIVLDSFMAEQMVVAQGTNCSYWLITHKTDSALFLAYKIDAAGIHTPPVYSTTGFPPQSSWGGEMKISSDYKKIVQSATDTAYNSVIELSDFDNATGVVSNTIPFDATSGITRYGYSFSPDNSKLYATNSLPSFFTTWGNVIQFDLSKLPNIADVEASKYELIKSQKAFAGMRLGPDDKIYVALPGTASIARINDPDKAGVACDFDSAALNQPTSTMFPQPLDPYYGHGLGSAVVPSPTQTIINPTIDTAMCINPETVIKVDTGYSDYVWDDSTTGNERNITKAGTYWVTYRDGSCYHYIDTFKVKAIEIDAQITINGHDLSTMESYVSYQWLLNDTIIPGATDSFYTVKENGNYRVIVENAQGCIDTSDVYKVNNAGIGGVDDWAQKISITPNPAHDIVYIQAPLKVNVVISSMEGKIIKQQKNARQVSVDGLAEGIYLMQISDQNNRLIKVVKFIKAK